jgi:hypothetical protein
MIGMWRSRRQFSWPKCFPDEIHDFLLHGTWVAAYRYEADFFERYLKMQMRR